MYNRYQLPIEETYEPAAFFPHDASCEEERHPTYPAPRPHPPLQLLSRPEEKEGIFSSLLRHFHLPKPDMDDLLLLAIAWLLLRDSGDEDLLLIMAALYLFN